MNLRTFAALAAACLAGVSVGSAQQGGSPVAVRGTAIAPKVPCAAMAGFTIAPNRIGLPTGGAKITSAALKPGTGPGAPAATYVPEYCEINGVMPPVDPKAPAINFQVNIPMRWNQMAWQFGADGSDGYVPSMIVIVRDTNQAPLGWTYPPDMPFPIAMGYATFGGDGGHQIERPAAGGPIPGQTRYPELPPVTGSLDEHVAAARKAEADRRAGGGPAVPPENEDWEQNDEAFTNFAHAHVKKTHDAGLAVIEHMYGARPRITYYTGNSNGGKSALQALSRYGADYDGILSTVAIPYYAARAMSQEYLRHIQRAPGAWVPPAKSAVIRNEIVRQCDSLDNLADGVISNYQECRRRMDPTITPNPLARLRCPGGADTGNTCLSDAQMATVNAFHAPVKIGFPLVNGESDFPGWPVGAEAPVGWLVTPNNPATAKPGGNNGMLLARVPGWDPAKLGAPSDITPAVQRLSDLVDPREDWSAFLKRNGKLILYHAASDYQVNGHGMFRLYEQAMKKNDRAAMGRSVRFYVAPNVGHGSYGISATTGEPLPPYIDLFTSLADWVEKEIPPPDSVLQTIKDGNPPYTVRVSRPLCRYPNYPRYTGRGDAKQAESYQCTAPASE